MLGAFLLGLPDGTQPSVEQMTGFLAELVPPGTAALLRAPQALEEKLAGIRKAVGAGRGAGSGRPMPPAGRPSEMLPVGPGGRVPDSGEPVKAVETRPETSPTTGATPGQPALPVKDPGMGVPANPGDVRPPEAAPVAPVVPGGPITAGTPSPTPAEPMLPAASTQPVPEAQPVNQAQPVMTSPTIAQNPVPAPAAVTAPTPAPYLVPDEGNGPVEPAPEEDALRAMLDDETREAALW